MITKLTTERAGSVALTLLPLTVVENLAGVDTELSITYAATDATVTPPSEMLSVEDPVLIMTATIVPSEFLKAATLVLAGAPEVATRTALGLMYRENIANAQRTPEGVTTVLEPEPVSVTRPAASLLACAPIGVTLVQVDQGEKGAC